MIFLLFTLLIAEPVSFKYNGCEAYVMYLEYNNKVMIDGRLNTHIVLYGHFDLRDDVYIQANIYLLTSSAYVLIDIGDTRKMCGITDWNDPSVLSLLTKTVIKCYCRKRLSDYIDGFLENKNTIRSVPR
jgi:hypothetical protein